ncbi:hypothetical protein [Ruminococcus sp.]|uniref:hypothetical protein n=1 Tax=Ruminococcus sp. TaxID=41978 RepID=UPI0039A0D5FA
MKIPKTLPSPALRITVTKIPTFFDNHKHSGTSHRLAMTIQAVPAADLPNSDCQGNFVDN